MHNIRFLLYNISISGGRPLHQPGGYTKISTDDTLRETISHGSEEYPFRFYQEDVWDFDFHCVDWHWHPEVEFVYVQTGTVVFLIGSRRYVLEAGTGIFINTGVIHRFESGAPARIPNIVFHPSLLASEDSLIYQKYVRPILHSSLECQIFSPEIPWQKDALQILLSVIALQESSSGNELQTLQTLLNLWGLLCSHAPALPEPSGSRTSLRSQAQLQILLQYIHRNYARRISLEELAGTVMLSQSSVMNLFQKYLRTSPIHYLADYRLKRAAKLLASTRGSVSQIAQECGFETSGYFCRRFKRLFGMTPGEYRRRADEDENLRK